MSVTLLAGCGANSNPTAPTPPATPGERSAAPLTYVGTGTGDTRRQLALRPSDASAPDPGIGADVYDHGPVRCIELSDAPLSAGGGSPPQQCMPVALLSKQDDLQGYAVRLRHGLALDGIADPQRISAIRVRRHGWPSGAVVTLPLSRSGGFALLEPGRFADGATYELRPVYRQARSAVMRLVGIGPILGGRPAARPAGDLRRQFAVLRRARTRADRIPGDRIELGAPGEFDANVRRSRLAARSGALRVWMVPGRRSVCVVVRLTAHGGGGVGCGSATEPRFLGGEEPIGSVTVGSGRSGHRLIVALLLPDGSRDAQLVWGDGHRRGVPMGPAGLIARVDGAARLTWRTADGRRHGTPLENPGLDP